MEFDRKTLLAVILIGLIFILMNTDFYRKRFGLMPPKKPPVEQQAQDSEQLLSGDAPAAEQEVGQGISQPALAERQQEQEQSFTAIDSLLGAGEDIIIETELYDAVFSSKGGTVKSWRLKEYYGPDEQPVQLVGQYGHGNLGVLLPAEEDTIDTGQMVFQMDKRKVRLTNRNQKETLAFTLDLGNGQRLKKTYTFYQGLYSIDLNIQLINLDKVVDGFSYMLTWRSGMSSTEPDFDMDMQNTRGYVFQGEVDDFDIGDEPEQELLGTSTDWVAIRTKYFTSAVIPKSAKGESVLFMGEPIQIGQEVPFKKFEYNLRMPFGQQARKTDEFTVYMGPLDYDILKSYNAGLEDMMDLGWTLFRPFGKFVLWSFTLLHEVIPNYGVVIIVFSILIKILLYPLTRKSYHSMKQMQALQPMMQEINEKYKKDPQKKQQAVMEMYREYGVNPLGGCIPMVLQMPLLIALFNVFQSTIELRGAEFAWWITDLSRPDTIATLPFSIPLYGDTVNILPLFMGVTMFIQQKISITDPKQKAMIYFMPLFLTLLFNTFPSGLNLYYALFNLLSIFQEKVIPHKVKTPEELKAEKKTKAKRQRRVKYDYRGRSR